MQQKRKLLLLRTLLCDEKRTVQTTLDRDTVVSLRSFRTAEEKVVTF